MRLLLRVQIFMSCAKNQEELDDLYVLPISKLIKKCRDKVTLNTISKKGEKGTLNKLGDDNEKDPIYDIKSFLNKYLKYKNKYLKLKNSLK